MKKMAHPGTGTIIGIKFESFVNWLNVHGSWFFDPISSTVQSFHGNLVSLLSGIPAWAFILIVVVLSALFISKQLAAINFIALTSIWGFTCVPWAGGALSHIWPWALETFALVFIAVLICLIIAIPLGVACAYYDKLWLVFRPICDLLQTIPMWVYMIPGVMFFKLGITAGLLATVLYAVAPPLRYTRTAVKNVEPGIVEAGKSLGATTWQRFRKIELPAAIPTIMTGINQCIMLALSMVVLAGLIGAGGLGDRIIYGMTKPRTPLAFEAGFATVATAIMFDRTSEGLIEMVREKLRLKQE